MSHTAAKSYFKEEELFKCKQITRSYLIQSFVSATNVKMEMGQVKSCQKGALESPDPSKKTAWTFPRRILQSTLTPPCLYPGAGAAVGQKWFHFTDSARPITSQSDSSHRPGTPFQPEDYSPQVLFLSLLVALEVASSQHSHPGNHRPPPACRATAGRECARLCFPPLSIITGVCPAASKREGRGGVGSLAPEEWLDACQVLSYSIPAAVERGEKHFTLLSLAERSSLWQLI